MMYTKLAHRIVRLATRLASKNGWTGERGGRIRSMKKVSNKSFSTNEADKIARMFAAAPVKPPLRRFHLVRDEDETGVSGTGLVAEGVEFSDGTVAMRWTTKASSTVLWKNLKDAMKIHGHDGKTRIEWLDEKE